MKKYNHEWLIAEWKRMGRPEVEIFSALNNFWFYDPDPKFHKERLYRIKSDQVIEGVVATNSNGETT